MTKLETDSLDAGLHQGGENRFILAPLGAQGLFPLNIRLDAVAVANVNRCDAAEPLRGPLERAHAPVRRVLHVDVESRFVKLNDVDAVRLQGQRLLVQKRRKGKGHGHLVAVEAVRHGIDDGHRAWQRELDLVARVRPQETRFDVVHPALQCDGRHHLRNLGVVAAITDAHRDLVLEIDALDALQKAMHEMLAGLLAIANDGESRILLRLDP